MLPRPSQCLLLAVLSLLAALPSTGCGSREDADAPVGVAPRIWTLRQLRERAIAGRALPGGTAATEWLTPRGRPLPQWSPPYHRLERVQAEGRDGFNVLPAFREGRPVAFAVLEVWEHMPEVWVQPWYVLVTAYDAAHPEAHRLEGALPLVDIGEDSVFYSPFWEKTYVVVPEGTPPDRYTSVVDLFAARLLMFRGGGLLAPLAPADVAPVATEGGTPVRPLSGDAVATPRTGEVWLRGRRVTYLDFGAGGFTWNTSARRHGAVTEVPLYLFATRDARGEAVSLGLPAVLGASGRPAPDMPGAEALTRPYLVLLPPGAGPFIPSEMRMLKQALRERGVTVVDAHPTVEHLAEAKDHVLRVALNPECFKDLVGFPQTCRWLDSRAAVEAHVEPSAVVPRDVLFTSPVLPFVEREAP
ncbi:hypothetical protein HPC49_24595 [Pyxidicoccus fallax]|uniref:Lipoprotein n=1 Tax=Pyxidicoccus fallax TaxID=394095 RepID=A0A848LLX0_9BACT|nr:hypothetical protein [Pyxidicoccus fallax]NMO18711.1 hypothetical protein [Pyxidicoccus fallax]NPC81397.1 hypothetical protein [Pyxidicoccus fallax]